MEVLMFNFFFFSVLQHDYDDYHVSLHIFLYFLLS